jgi:hypothetical protein
MGGREDEQSLGNVKRCVLVKLVAAVGKDFGLELPLGREVPAREEQSGKE